MDEHHERHPKSAMKAVVAIFNSGDLTSVETLFAADYLTLGGGSVAPFRSNATWSLTALSSRRSCKDQVVSAPLNSLDASYAPQATEITV